MHIFNVKMHVMINYITIMTSSKEIDNKTILFDEDTNKIIKDLGVEQ